MEQAAPADMGLHRVRQPMVKSNGEEDSHSSGNGKNAWRTPK